jgi:hypothetical protein
MVTPTTSALRGPGFSASCSLNWQLAMLGFLHHALSLEAWTMVKPNVTGGLDNGKPTVTGGLDNG